MLVCITSRFVISDSCNKEASLGDLLRKPIVPVMIEKTPWPPPGPLALIFSQHIYADLAGSGGHGGCGKDADWSVKMRELIRRLRLYTNPPPRKPLEIKKVEDDHEVVEAVEAAPVGAAPPLADRESHNDSHVDDDVRSQSWSQGDPGRGPCCVNICSFLCPRLC
jgi:hypothetical protein